MPRALKRLLISSRTPYWFCNEELWNNHNLQTCDEYFKVISSCPSSHSLVSLKFDMEENGRFIVVPTPGLHELQSVRSLDISPPHVYLKEDFIGRLYLGKRPIPQVNCSLQQLFPPNLEILKVISMMEGCLSILWDIIHWQVLPSLQKIILCLDCQSDAEIDSDTQSRTEASEDRDQDHSLEETEGRETIEGTSEEKKWFSAFVSACEEQEVELEIRKGDGARMNHKWEIESDTYRLQYRLLAQALQ